MSKIHRENRDGTPLSTNDFGIIQYNTSCNHDRDGHHHMNNNNNNNNCRIGSSSSSNNNNKKKGNKL